MISCVIPVYNVSKYLSRCLDSVISQTYTDLEIIVVDDGSTDGSSDICDEYAARDARIRVIHQKNAGLSGARNSGIDVAHGEYLAFVDSDDFIHPAMYETLLNIAVKTEAEMTVSRIVRVSEADVPAFSFAPVDATQTDFYLAKTREEIFEQLKKRDVQTVVAWTKLYKTELFEDIRFPLGRLHEDAAVIHEVLWKCKRVAYAEAELYCYVQHEAGIMHSTLESEKGILDGIAAYEDRILFFDKKGETALKAESVQMLFQNLEYKFSLLSANGYTERCAWLGEQVHRLIECFGGEGLSKDQLLLGTDPRAYFNEMKRREKRGAFKASLLRLLRLTP